MRNLHIFFREFWDNSSIASYFSFVSTLISVSFFYAVLPFPSVHLLWRLTPPVHQVEREYLEVVVHTDWTPSNRGITKEVFLSSPLKYKERPLPFPITVTCKHIQSEGNFWWKLCIGPIVEWNTEDIAAVILGSLQLQITYQNFRPLQNTGYMWI
jgi:hypothetical protein